MYQNSIYTLDINLETLPDSVLLVQVVENTCQIIDANTKSLSTFNKSKEQLVNQTIKTLFSEVTSRSIQTMLLEVVQTKQGKSLVLPLYEDEILVGSRYFLAVAFETDKIFLSYKEISADSLVKKQMKVTRDVLDETQKVAHVGDWKWDMLTNEVYWSDEVYRIFGESPHAFEPSFEAFLSFLNPSDQENLQECIKNAIEKNEAYDIEHQVHRRDGSIAYVKGSGHTQFNSEGVPIVMLGQVFDITKEKMEYIKLQESETKFKQVVKSPLMGVFIYKETFIYANEAIEEMLGYSNTEMLKIHPWDVVETSMRATLKEIIQRRLEGESFPHNYNDIKLIDKEGTIKIMRIATQTIMFEGSYAGMGTVMDVTDLLASQTQIKLLNQAVEQMDEMVRITDKEGVITYVNGSALTHTGYKESDLIGQKISILKSGQHPNSIYKELWETILLGETYKGILINRKKNGTLFYEEQTITPLYNSYKEINGFVSTSHDITSRIALENKLQHLAAIDSLTAIYNRHKISEIIVSEIDRASRYKESFGLIMFDLDFFKKVNDNYGHDVGDSVLKEISKLIGKDLRKTDSFGRWGGEEFIIVLPAISKTLLLEKAERIRLLVDTHTFETIGNITISLGVTLFETGENLQRIYKRVDDALYSAKESGRNKVVYQSA